MQLYIREIYRLDGHDFRSLAETKKHVENEIGNILDKTSNRLPAKLALEIFEVIVANRKRLVELLTVEIESDEWQGEVKNLLDVEV